MAQNMTAQETGATYTLAGTVDNNLMPNGAFGTDASGWAYGTNTGITTSALARGTTAWPGHTTGYLALTGTKDANTTQRTLNAITSTGTSGMMVSASHRYQAQATFATPSTTNPDQGVRLAIYWYQSGGSASAVTSVSTGSLTVLAANTETTLSLEAVAPSDALYAAVSVEAVSSTSSDVMTFYADNVTFYRMARAVFNDTTDTDYICGLAGDDAITGLDSPEVRESYADLSESDGAIHGTFYSGRRPITISGTVVSTTSSDRASKMTKVSEAFNALSSDSTLTWTPSGSISQFVRVRKQQPTRFAGAGTAKSFFGALVAADPLIYSSTLRTHDAQAVATGGGPYTLASPLTIQNRGNADTSFEIIRVRWASGTITAIEVRVGGALGPIVVSLSSLSLATGTPVGQIEINTRLRTVTDQTGASAYSKVDFTTSTWATIPTGYSQFYIKTTGGTATADIAYRDAWL
jgi:hypothetical protein